MLCLLLLQLLHAERTAGAAQKLVEEVKEQQRKAEVALVKQQEAAKQLQDELARAIMERTHAQHQLLAAENKVYIHCAFCVHK